MVVLWLWRRPTAAAPIPPLVQELTYATGSALKRQKKKKKKKKVGRGELLRIFLVA